MKLTDLVGDSVVRNYRIVVIGDSLSAQQGILAPAWPTLLENALKASGAPIEVVNLAVNGATYYIANTVTKFSTRTQVTQAISLKPDMVIVALGFNDTVMGVGGRTLVQAKADALTLMTDLKTALPQVKVVYASQLPYDSVNATPATALNKHILPFAMERAASGLLSGCVTEEILPNAAPSAHKAALDNWVNLDTYIKANLPLGGTSIQIPLWKAARLGLLSNDGLHPKAEGSLFWAGAVRLAFTSNGVLSAALPYLSNQDYASFNDPDEIFNGLLQVSASAYIPKTPTVTINHPVWQHGPWTACNVQTWFMPSKGSFITSSLTTGQYSPFLWELRGVSPFEVVYTSMDSAAFTSVGTSTDFKGDIVQNKTLALTTGSHTLRIKVKDEVYGPIALTIDNSGGGGTKAAFGRLTGLANQYTSRTASAYTTVPFATTGATALNGMTTGTYSLVVPRTGWYLVIGCFMVMEPTAVMEYGLGTIVVNGTRFIESSPVILSNTSMLAATYPASGTLYLAAGAIVTMTGFGTSNGTFQDNATTSSCHLTVKELLDIL